MRRRYKIFISLFLGLGLASPVWAGLKTGVVDSVSPNQDGVDIARVEISQGGEILDFIYLEASELPEGGRSEGSVIGVRVSGGEITSAEVTQQRRGVVDSISPNQDGVDIARVEISSESGTEDFVYIPASELPRGAEREGAVMDLRVSDSDILWSRHDAASERAASESISERMERLRERSSRETSTGVVDVITQNQDGVDIAAIELSRAGETIDFIYVEADRLPEGTGEGSILEVTTFRGDMVRADETYKRRGAVDSISPDADGNMIARIEVSNNGHVEDFVYMDVSELPRNAGREGSVLDLRVNSDGRVLWSRHDAAAEEASRASIAERMDALRSRSRTPTSTHTGVIDIITNDAAGNQLARFELQGGRELVVDIAQLDSDGRYEGAVHKLALSNGDFIGSTYDAEETAVRAARAQAMRDRLSSSQTVGSSNRSVGFGFSIARGFRRITRIIHRMITGG